MEAMKSYEYIMVLFALLTFSGHTTNFPRMIKQGSAYIDELLNEIAINRESIDKTINTMRDAVKTAADKLNITVDKFISEYASNDPSKMEELCALLNATD